MACGPQPQLTDDLFFEVPYYQLIYGVLLHATNDNVRWAFWATCRASCWLCPGATPSGLIGSDVETLPARNAPPTEGPDRPTSRGHSKPPPAGRLQLADQHRLRSAMPPAGVRVVWIEGDRDSNAGGWRDRAPLQRALPSNCGVALRAGDVPPMRACEGRRDGAPVVVFGRSVVAGWERLYVRIWCNAPKSAGISRATIGRPRNAASASGIGTSIPILS